MKKVLLCFLITLIPYVILIQATASQILHNIREPLLEDLLPQVEIGWQVLREIRPALHPDSNNLSDKDRAGLLGPVKTVRAIEAEFLNKGDEYARLTTYGNYEKSFYNTTGKLLITESDRRGGCGFRDPEPPIKKIYNDRGFLVVELFFQGPRPTIQSRTTYAYAPDGRVLEKCIYDAEGKLTWKQIYEYKIDSYGNWIEQIPVLVLSDREESGKILGQFRQISYYNKESRR